MYTITPKDLEGTSTNSEKQWTLLLLTFFTLNWYSTIHDNDDNVSSNHWHSPTPSPKTMVTMELPNGLAYEMHALPSSPSPSCGLTTLPPPARAAPDSWLLQQHSPEPQVMWEGSKLVHQQVLEEMIHTCCPEADHHSLLLTLAA